METNSIFLDYMSKAPNMNKIHYWDLHSQLCVGFSSIHDPKIKMLGDSITIKRLRSIIVDKPEIEKDISFVFLYKNLKRKLDINLPLSLDNINFVNLYALMVSEGSYRTEFRLHAPEKIFHNIFINNLEGLFGKNIKRYIIQKTQKGIMRSTAPCAIRYFLPITLHIPKFILKNKEYCRKYLQIAFEAEGSPIFNGSKRYISLKRNVDITTILKNKIKYPEGKRIYTGQLEKDYPELASEIKKIPPPTLLGEHLILKHYFNVYSTIKPEAIRINKTDYRCGKISARWSLYISADSVNRFIKEINFLSKRKRTIAHKMSKIKGYKRRYFALEIMKKIQKNKIVKSSDFVKEMKSHGYVSPRAYIWRYMKRGLLKRTKYGEYKLLVN